MPNPLWDEHAMKEWKTYGVFLSRMTPEEWKGGGIWLIGTNWPDGYPGKTDRVFYKSWCTWPEKYGPGHYEPKNRLENNEWEFVQVLNGCLVCCVEENAGTKRFPLERMECVDVRPDPLRYWQFSEGKEPFASGISFFRRNLRASPLQPGAGDGYEFRLWQSDQAADRMKRPVNLSAWAVQFVEVLSPEGQIEACVRTLAADLRTYTLSQREHLFLHRGVTVEEWCCRGHPSGIVVYLQ